MHRHCGVNYETFSEEPISFIQLRGLSAAMIRSHFSVFSGGYGRFAKMT
jgi:hypothetical protein